METEYYKWRCGCEAESENGIIPGGLSCPEHGEPLEYVRKGRRRKVRRRKIRKREKGGKIERKALP